MADVMTRYARLYSDGSLNVSNEGECEEKARHMLNESGDDDDTALVQIELTIVRRCGTPKLALVDHQWRGLVFIEDDGTIRLPNAKDI